MTTPFSPGRHLRKVNGVSAHTRGRYKAACPVGLNPPKSPYGSSRRRATSALERKAARKSSEHRIQNLFFTMPSPQGDRFRSVKSYNPLRGRKLRANLPAARLAAPTLRILPFLGIAFECATILRFSYLLRCLLGVSRANIILGIRRLQTTLVTCVTCTPWRSQECLRAPSF